jgi:hypothetical protein
LIFGSDLLNGSFIGDFAKMEAPIWVLLFNRVAEGIWSDVQIKKELCVRTINVSLSFIFMAEALLEGS